MLRQAIALSAAALLTTSLAAAAGEEKPFPLMVGDPAPSLKVEQWVQGEPVAGLQEGQVYVVEFWATWCGPCRRIIPHVNELQKSYGDEVRFVSVSIDKEHAKVAPFVEAMGDRMAYAVATDRSESGGGHMETRWMDAAGQDGIPSAFVVDGTGTIAWIGHPAVIDEPLAQIAAGTWDLERAELEHMQRMIVQAKFMAAQKEIGKAMKERRFAEALAATRNAIEQIPDMAPRFAGTLNQIAWAIVDPDGEGERDLKTALAAGKQACEMESWENASYLDTYALALYLSGDVERAVEIQAKAVELAAGSPMQADLEARLEQFKTGTHRTQGL